MAKIDINNPAVQKACFHFLRFHVGIGSRQEHESFAREVLLAATEFMFQTSGTARAREKQLPRIMNRANPLVSIRSPARAREKLRRHNCKLRRYVRRHYRERA